MLIRIPITDKNSQKAEVQKRIIDEVHNII